MHKSVRVMTNDPAHQTVVLDISGSVEKFVTITPTVAQLRGPQGEPREATVEIIPTKKHPFAITEVTVSPNPRFTHKLEKKPGGAETGWTLTVSDPECSGNYSGTVFLHTDSKERPKVEVRVIGSFTRNMAGTIPPPIKEPEKVEQK